MTTAFIGVGSNLGNPIQQVKTAINDLANIENTEFITASSLYRTKPVGIKGQPDFINAVAKLSTRLSCQDLLTQLISIEQAHDRVRGEKWGPRTLDLDILLFGDATINTEGLVVPHPRMFERAFVLIPLAEIDPNVVQSNGIALQKAQESECQILE